MKKILSIAILLLNLLTINDTLAQTYSKEYIILNDLWERALNSSASIYAEYYDDSYLQDLEKELKKLEQQTGLLSQIEDGRKYAVSPSNQDYNGYDISNPVKGGTRSGYTINEDGSISSWRYIDLNKLNADLDGGWLDEVECEGDTRLCPYCLKWIRLENWDSHNCRDDIDLLPQDVSFLPSAANVGIVYSNRIEPIMHNPENTYNDSMDVGYHRCPCLVTINGHFYWNIIDNDPIWDTLDKQYDGIKDALKRHIAFPETIQQGNNGTCAAALLQKYLVESFPEKYIECVQNLATTGNYAPWGIEIPQSIGLTGITDFELDKEIDNKEYKDLGINYTSVDALMQTAIQNWADNNTFGERFWNQITGYAYNPLNDFGYGGGMSSNEEYMFLRLNMPLNSIIYKNKIDFEDLKSLIENNNPDSYTFMAGVRLQLDKLGYYFDSEGEAHALEVRGITNGVIDYWSWGKYGATTKDDCPINNLLIIKKSDYAKNEKKNRQDLKCNCPSCTNTHCDMCMQK